MNSAIKYSCVVLGSSAVTCPQCNRDLRGKPVDIESFAVDCECGATITEYYVSRHLGGSFGTRPESIHMREATGECEVHTWPDAGLPRRLVDTMRARHGHGGVNVCIDCIGRAKRIADVERGFDDPSTNP